MGFLSLRVILTVTHLFLWVFSFLETILIQLPDPNPFLLDFFVGLTRFSGIPNPCTPLFLTTTVNIY